MLAVLEVKGRKAHLLEDKQIPSVGVFDEVFSTWMAFGGNTRDLGSFGEETDEIMDLHQDSPRNEYEVSDEADEHEISDEYLTEEQQQLLLQDKEALRETLEEEARHEKEWEARMKEEEAHNDYSRWNLSTAKVNSFSTHDLLVKEKIALMAYTSQGSSSSSSSDSEREALNKSNLEIIGYQIGLESLEARIVVHEKNEAVYEEDIAFLKYDVQTSKDIVEKPKTVRPSSPIIEEWDTGSDNDSVFRPKSDQTKSKFTKINFVKSGENVKTVNKENTHRQVEYLRKSPREKLVLNNKGRVTGQREIRPVWNNSQRVNHQNKLTQTHPKRNFVPTTVATKSGQVPVNAAKQSSLRAAASISTARPVNTVAPKPKVKDALPITYSYFKAHSPVRRAFNQKSAAKTNNFNEKVNTVRVNNVTTAGPKAIVSAAEGNGENAFKSSACWIFDSGCSRHMTGNKSFLTDYQENGGFLAFGGSPKGDAISDEFGVKTGSCKVNAARQDLVLMGEINNVKQIHATVDGKTIVILESSVRSDSSTLNDDDGQPIEPQPAPYTTQPIIEEQIPVTESSSPQNTQTPRQALQEDTQLPQTSVPIPNVADEAVHKELGNRVVISSGDKPMFQEAMRGVIAQTRSERASKHSYDSPLSGVNTPGSDEERNEHQDLTDNIPPTPHDSPLLGGHTPRSDEDFSRFGDQKLKKKVKRLEKKQRARTSGMKLFKIGTSKRKSLDKENVSKQGRNLKTRPMFEEGDFDDDFDDIDDMVNEAMENVEGDTVNTATTRVSAASASFTIAGVSISTDEPRTPPTTTTTAFEDKDLTIAQTLVKMRKQRIARERAAEQEAKDAVLIEQMEYIQARMDAYELLVERLQQEEREQSTIKEKSRMLVEMIAEMKRNLDQYEREQKWINDFVPMDSEVVKDSRKGKAEGSRKKTVARKRTGEKPNDESVKRQKIEDDDEKEELRAYLDIIPGDDEAINVESLATKYPIVDWKTHVLSEDKMYYEIIRVDRSTKFYKIFTEMLDDFDRQDVLDLYKLVKERFETASPEGYDRLIWGDLITLFESSEEDEPEIQDRGCRYFMWKEDLRLHLSSSLGPSTPPSSSPRPLTPPSPFRSVPL
ncbi:hypothetical protein Tco_0629993 [Tanacetum coccineum]|uniref:Retrovirus-related Pol polyprotein from transposon TNT 1-94-like beta-barrel domain-containing protein n=1 Tax=Tanacetum coccineum TaxID=301880 RepID=A0ABQ4WUP9_9ASTR